LICWIELLCKCEAISSEVSLAIPAKLEKISRLVKRTRMYAVNLININIL
jgi:hypothetical protein